MEDKKYLSAVKKIFDLQFFGIKLGLLNIKRLLNDLENPQDSFKVVLVAGTNGKGSVASTLASICKEAGLVCGLFTSPHLVRFNERFAINGMRITDLEVLDIADKLWAVVDRHQKMEDPDGPSPITFFEFATAMACLFFKNHNVEIGIFECGLGGKLDATNALDPVLDIFTPISIDHTQYLGETITAIATEKSGILRKGTPAVVSQQTDEARAALFAKFKELEVPSFIAGRDYEIIRRNEKSFFKDQDGLIGPVTTSLSGAYQLQNTSVAIAAARVLKRMDIPIPDHAILSGPKKVHWPGRLEKVGEKPTIILDGAHNMAAARLLAKTLKEESYSGKTIGILSVMRDKDAKSIVKYFVPAFDIVITTDTKMARTTPSDELAKIIEEFTTKVTHENDLKAALKKGVELAGDNGRVVICGSLFLVGEARAILLGEKSDGPKGKWVGVRG